MSDTWTGRKYRGNQSGRIYTVLSEPFEFNGAEYIVWQEPSHNNGNPFAEQNGFKHGPFTRVIEPKYAVGDKVTNGYDVYRIVGVASEPDGEGDFAYLVKPIGEDDTDILWESHIEGKESE
jgi:hypothetical protein